MLSSPSWRLRLMKMEGDIKISNLVTWVSTSTNYYRRKILRENRGTSKNLALVDSRYILKLIKRNMYANRFQFILCYHGREIQEMDIEKCNAYVHNTIYPNEVKRYKCSDYSKHCCNCWKKKRIENDKMRVQRTEMLLTIYSHSSSITLLALIHF